MSPAARALSRLSLAACGTGTGALDGTERPSTPPENPGTSGGTSSATAGSAIRALLAGPGRAEGHRARTTAIPSGTELRSVVIRNRVATVRPGSGQGHLLEIEGEPVKQLGGEGLVLNGPVGRGDFEGLSPAVTFEAEFRLKVTDAIGHTAADVQVRATSGTGSRGTFDVVFPYTAARSGPSLPAAYFISPEDDRPLTVDTVPPTVNA